LEQKETHKYTGITTSLAPESLYKLNYHTALNSNSITQCDWHEPSEYGSKHESETCLDDLH